MEQIRGFLEERQITIYLVATAVAALVGLSFTQAAGLKAAINPALAFMLFVTFLQIPLTQLGSALRNTRFIGALLAANFVVMPLLTALLVQFLPDEPMLRLAVLLVLLTPCIDYVVTFTHVGRGSAGLLLAATPALLLLQLLLLPVYLGVLFDNSGSALVQPEPFLHAFFWLIALPLLAAAAFQFWSARAAVGNRARGALELTPVPATALVLFFVLASVMPQIETALVAALTVVPVYLAYAIFAPVLGWVVARSWRLDAGATRAVAFSAATRNSLVILPLAFAVPGGVPLVPAVVVTQTIIELISELLYVRWIPRLPVKLPA